MIHVEQCHRRTTCSRFSDDRPAIITPTKMLAPLLLTGVKEPNTLTALGVKSHHVILLGVVAHRAGEAEVVQVGWTAGCLRKDMVDLEWLGAQILPQPAIFAQ